MKKMSEKKKKNIIRVIMLICAILMIMSFVILPLSSSVNAQEDEGAVVVTEFSTGELAAAIDKAKDGTDLNLITKISVSGGTLNAADYSAICGYPNIEFLELAGCDTEGGIIPDNALASRNQITYISLPANTVSIGTRAFSNNRTLVKISMPSTVRNIGDYAFDGCERVESFSVPAELETLGTGAFSDCKALSSFAVPEAVTKIPDYCFSKSCMTELHLGPQVTAIGEGAFSDCHDLADIYFYGDKAPTAPESAFQNLRVTIHTYEGGEGFDSLDSNFVDIAYDLSDDSVYTPPVSAEPAAKPSEDKPAEDIPSEENGETVTDAVQENTSADTQEAVTEAESSVFETEQSSVQAAPVSAEPSSQGGFGAASVIVIALLCAAVGVLATLLAVKSKKN